MESHSDRQSNIKPAVDEKEAGLSNRAKRDHANRPRHDRAAAQARAGEARFIPRKN
ncbi:MAG: hypothetical protein M3014_13580 [Chloroflexota bacterium]|nr:hypothetical protein [Chloroflexota bacterium]